MKMMLVIKKVHHMNRSAEQEFDENEMNEIYHFTHDTWLVSISNIMPARGSNV